MPTTIEALIRQGATNISNPDRTRVTTDDWIEFYNAVARDIGTRLFSARYTALFDLQNDSDYDYPDDMTRLIKLWVTESPSDPDSFRVLKEIREDQFVDRVTRNYPSATLPEEYLPEATLFRVVPKPAAAIVQGGKIEYWGLPLEIVGTLGTFMQFPDLMREWVVEGMTILALKKLKQIIEANDRYRVWSERESDYAAMLTDRADDRRPAMVPRPAKNKTRGMV